MHVISEHDTPFIPSGGEHSLYDDIQDEAALDREMEGGHYPAMAMGQGLRIMERDAKKDSLLGGHQRHGAPR